VRLIDETGENIGLISIKEALQKAEDAGLDLVEVSGNMTPPVCKIVDFGKYRYELQKKKAEAKKNQKIITVKEVKIRPTTDVNDYQVKLRNMQRFLDKGDKVKVSLRFRGREMAHREVGRQVLERIIADLKENAKVELAPKMEGRQMLMILVPAK